MKHLAALAPLVLALAAAPASADGPSGTLFVAGKRGNTLSKIDLATGREVLRVPTCANPHELAVAPDGKHVALACYGGQTVDIFATGTLSRVVSIDLGEKARPHGIVWQQDEETGRDTIFVTAEGRGSIFAIDYPLENEPDLMTEIATEAKGTHMIVVSADGDTAWTTDLVSGTVTQVEIMDARVLKSVSIGLIEPEGIALTPDGKRVWVTARNGDAAYAVEAENFGNEGQVATGRFPIRIAIRPQGDVAVTSNLRDGSLSVIDLAAREVIRTIPVSSPAEAEKRQQVTILWSKDGERIYAAETGTDTVAEIDYASGTVTRRIAVGEGGDGMAFLP